jgi:predicted nucleic-acid-binding Zn-ribbon protein
MKCQRCSGTRIVEGELDAFSAIALRLQTPVWFRETGVRVVINICIDCGYLEFQATDLARLQQKVAELGIKFKA